MTNMKFLSTQIKTAFCIGVFVKSFGASFLAIFMLAFPGMVLSQESKTSDWSQFRGNLRNGQNIETSAIEAWPESGPPLLWTKAVGNGFAEVTSAAGNAYIFSSDSLGGGYEYLAAIEIETGNERWKTKVDSLYFEVDGWGHGPRSTPVIDDEAIYCLSGFGKLTALSIKDGSKLWMVDIPKEFGSTQPRWGYSSSPVLVENLLILETGGAENRAYTALDRKTGKTIWSKGICDAGYNSPAIANINGQNQIIFAADTMLFAFDLAGNQLWDFKMPFRQPTAMPVFIGPDKFFLSTVSDVGSLMIQVANNTASQVWTNTAMQNEWSTSCYHKGFIYGISKTKLVCVSAETGEMKWGQRGFGKGSLIILGDKLIVLSDQGLVTVVDASPEKYTKIGSFQALQGKSWTAPSFAEGKLFVRNLSTMSCFKLIK